MSGSIVLSIRLFGAFRGLAQGEVLSLSVPTGATLAQAASSANSAPAKSIRKVAWRLFVMLKIIGWHRGESN